MARTLGDKVDDLSKSVYTLDEALRNLRKEVETISRAHSETANACRELKTEVALIRQELASVRKDQEKWGQRLWMILAPLIATVVGGLLVYHFTR